MFVATSMRDTLQSLERKVLDSARGARLFGPDDHVLVALSGGADSTALLAALATARSRGALATLSACHVDHRLRVGSAADGDACAALCALLAVPFHRVEVEVPVTENVQAAARRERYRALRRVASACGADRIATAHTRSDQAETVLHRLLRGSGARGLGGIPPRRGRIVRPLLAVSRAEVLSYLAARGLSWREDPTNATPRFLRNRLRHEILPALERLSPGVERRLARTATLLRDDDRVLDRLARRIAPVGAARASVEELLAAPVAIRRRAVRLLWRAATGTRRSLGSDHVDAVLRLLPRARPGVLRLPQGFVARIAYGAVEITVTPAAPPRPIAAVAVNGSGMYEVPALGTVAIRWQPARHPPPWPLELRTRRPGDRFHPAGAPGGKKLKAWLIDRKIPRDRRDGLLVVADRHGNVLSLPQLGVRAAGWDALDVTLRAP